jgi:hypothetical protein
MPIKPFAATGAPGIIVPSTRQLIVETLSVQVDVTPPGTRLEAFINYKSGGQDVQLFVPLTYAYTEPSTNFDFHVAMQEVRLYPDKDTTMAVTVYAPGGDPGTLFLTVSGQLV